MQAFSQQGFNLTAWDKSGFSDRLLDLRALQYIKDEGSNLVTIDYAVNFNADGTIIDVNSSSSRIPNAQDLIYVIDAAHQMGMQVVLKPHITLPTSADNVNLSNTSTSNFLATNFFPAWKAYLSSLALTAQTHSVEGIAIGTEFNLYDSSNRTEWVDIISSLRGLYSGQLTYDALFSVYTNFDSTAKVCFWDQLDYIGCSLYVPMSSNDAAPQSELVGAFLNNPYGSIGNIVSYLAAISAKYGKQIMALEGGYQSVVGALDQANLNTLPNSSQVISNSTQVNGLNAYLYALEAYGATWLKGVSLWQVTPSNMTPTGLNSIWHTNEFTSYQKPSAQTIADYFQGKTSYLSNFTVAANGQKFYGGLLNNSYEVVKSNAEPSSLVFNLTGSIVNGQTPTIDLYVNDNLVDSFHLINTPSTYYDSHGINWNVNKLYTTQYTGALQTVKLVFKGNPGNGTSEGSYIHGFSIDGSPQNLTKTIASSSGVTTITDSMWLGTTSTLDLSNRQAAIASGTEIHGGPLLDQVHFSGLAKNFQIEVTNSATVTVSSFNGSLDSSIKAINVERLQFTDTNLALDISPTQTAGSVYMLYQATFNRKPDAAGLGYWINAVDKGADITKDVAAAFVKSGEFVAKYGSNPTNASYIDNLYQNVLHRPGEAGGVAYWNQELDAGRISKAAVLEAFATLPEGASLVVADIASGIAYTQWVG